MNRNVTAYTAPELAPTGQVVPYASFNVDAGGDMEVTARNAEGVQVTVVVPERDWRRMVREMVFSAEGASAA